MSRWGDGWEDIHEKLEKSIHNGLWQSQTRLTWFGYLNSPTAERFITLFVLSVESGIMSAEESYVKRLEGICATAVAEKMEARVSHRTYQCLNFTEKSNASKETREGTWRRVAKLRHSVCLKNIFSTLTHSRQKTSSNWPWKRNRKKFWSAVK